MTVFDFSCVTASGTETSLSQYKGKVLLVVNVASKCGFTPQYEGLQKLFAKYQDRGLVVLGFPCNQFGHQEPGSDEEVQRFCQTDYGVKFPVFGKIDVNGASAHPLYKFLTEKVPGILGIEMIKWNFTKFLVGRDGAVLHRYAPLTKPEQLESDIEKALAGSPS